MDRNYIFLFFTSFVKPSTQQVLDNYLLHLIVSITKSFVIMHRWIKREGRKQNVALLWYFFQPMLLYVCLYIRMYVYIYKIIWKGNGHSFLISSTKNCTEAWKIGIWSLSLLKQLRFSIWRKICIEGIWRPFFPKLQTMGFKR